MSPIPRPATADFISRTGLYPDDRWAGRCRSVQPRGRLKEVSRSVICVQPTRTPPRHPDRADTKGSRVNGEKLSRIRFHSARGEATCAPDCVEWCDRPARIGRPRSGSASGTWINLSDPFRGHWSPQTPSWPHGSRRCNSGRTAGPSCGWRNGGLRSGIKMNRPAARETHLR
jgi:hypothetical protein